MSSNLENMISVLTESLPNLNEVSFSYLREEKIWICQISFDMGNTLTGRGAALSEALFNAKTLCYRFLEAAEDSPLVK